MAESLHVWNLMFFPASQLCIVTASSLSMTLEAEHMADGESAFSVLFLLTWIFFNQLAIYRLYIHFVKYSS